jgi:hypothetical protein
MKTPKVKMKIPDSIYEQMLEDLKRLHSHAHERVGFLFIKSKLLFNKTVLILATEYIPVADEDYIRDNTVGARINAAAIKKAMQGIYDRKGGCFHVHLHAHSGKPSPSGIDKEGLPGVVNSFSNISGQQANGILILSQDDFFCSVKLKDISKPVTPFVISIIGYPMRFHFSDNKGKVKQDIYSRQSFLGKSSSLLFEKIAVGIIGYGGGGSHVGQQLAHIGVTNLIVFDNDIIEESNLNRLVGAWFADIGKALKKTAIAKRTINKILPASKALFINTRWQDNPELIQQCDIVIGCVDSYAQREQAEAECRRYLIPYIDIGMDIQPGEENPFDMYGQVLLSMPDKPCLHCFGFLNQDKLAKEAAKYGAVGARPQVVWPNGVLASSAVGICVDLITNWTKRHKKNIYLSYDGNNGTLNSHVRSRFAPEKCSHYMLTDAGPPRFIKL